MPALPPSSDFTGSTRTNAEVKVTHAALRSYLAGLLGEDGTPATALAALGALVGAGVTPRTGATTLTAADRGRVVLATANTWALTLPALAGAPAGWAVLVVNAGAGTVTLTRAGSDLIDGAATQPLAAGGAALVVSTGSAWATVALAAGLAAGRLLRGGDVTTSSSDTTAGRVLKVGDFGLGGSAPLAGNISVEDNTLPPGFLTYNTVAGSSGGPAGVDRGMLIHYRRVAGGGGEVQVLVVESGTGPISGAMFTRSRVTGTWGAWRRYFRDSDVIGTVAQTGGLPTGALLETASNANGRYTRFADGTQICWRTMAAGSGAATTWTFPAAFIAAPAVTGNAVATVLSAVCLDAAPSTTAATFSARDKADARRADTCHLRAEGRWF